METGDQSRNQNQTTATNTPTPTTTETAHTTSATVASEKKTLMAVLAYISILILIPFLTAKDDPFVKFHIKQGAVLFVLNIIVIVVGMLMFTLKPILGILNIGISVLAIFGIVNAIQGKEEEVPLVGQFSKHFNF